MIKTVVNVCMLVVILCAVPAFASAPSFPPDITTNEVGTLLGDGHYLWSFDVFYGQKPKLSHWVLIDLCKDVFDDIVPGSLFGGTGFSYGFDPTTGVTGLKFETADATDSGHGFFGFETTKCWEPGLFKVAFKAGTHVTFQDDVVGPSCEECDRDHPVVPEPASLGLLGFGILPLVNRKILRRLRSNPLSFA